jgi:hypothetical protein
VVHKQLEEVAGVKATACSTSRDEVAACSRAGDEAAACSRVGLRMADGGSGTMIYRAIEERERARGQKIAKCCERECEA